MNSRNTTSRWEHFDHGADIGVRGIGGTLDEAFAQAALALTAVVTSLEDVSPESSIDLHCKESDPELLFVDWLNALIYEMATRKMLFSRFEINLDMGKLEATAWGEKIDIGHHQPAVEIKGATYTALHVGKNNKGQWVAETVIDV